MKRKTALLSILVLLLLLTLAACGGKKDASDQATDGASSSGAAAVATSPAKNPTNTPVPPTNTPVPPTNTPVPPTATPEPEEELTSDFARIEDVVDAYHSVGEISYSISATPASEDDNLDINMKFTSDWVKADNAAGYNVATTISGFDMLQPEGEDSQDLQEMSMIELDDTTYLNINGEWMTMPRDTMGEDSGPTINIDDFVGSADELKKVGTETINGVKTIHYQYKDTKQFEESLTSMMEGQLGDKEDLSQFEMKDTKVSGDIWVAKKGKYAVKAEINLETTFKAKEGDKEVHIEGRTSVEITDINGDITIEPPADVPAKGSAAVPGFGPDEFPMPEKTTVEGSFGGMINLTSELSADEINAFYDKELTNLGWTKEGVDMMTTWSKGDNSFVLMISPKDDGGSEILIMNNSEQ